MPQPDFDRVRTALSGDQPDRIPLAEVGIDPKVKAAFLGKPITCLQDEIEFWYYAGYDYVLFGRELGLGFFPGIRYGRPLQSDEAGTAPKRAWADEGHGVITNMAEFESYPWPDPAQADYAEYEQAGQHLPAGMKGVFYSGPIFQWIWMLMGFEAFCIALRENIELIRRLFHWVGQTRLQLLENALRRFSDIGAVWILDDIAYSEGLIVSPQLIREFLFPWFRKIRDVCDARDLPLIYHSDGAYWQVLDDILDLGFNAIHPIEPKGMGADIPELKERIGNRLCLIGGVNLDILIRGTPGDVARETRRMMAMAGQGGGYIVGSSNTVTDNVPLNNYRAMVETALECGQHE